MPVTVLTGDPPWRSLAEKTASELLVTEFVDAASLHREKCETCREGGPWCDLLRAAFDAVHAWHLKTDLRARAFWLAARQEELEAERLARWGIRCEEVTRVAA